MNSRDVGCTRHPPCWMLATRNAPAAVNQSRIAGALYNSFAAGTPDQSRSVQRDQPR